MRGVGSGIKEFKDAVKEEDKNLKILINLKTLTKLCLFIISLGYLQQIC